jgi:hypothetical protein
MGVTVSALALGAGLVFLFSFLWGKSEARGAENKVIREAFENAGLSREAFDKVMSQPLDDGPGLFDDWV